MRPTQMSATMWDKSSMAVTGPWTKKFSNYKTG